MQQKERDVRYFTEHLAGMLDRAQTNGSSVLIAQKLGLPSMLDAQQIEPTFERNQIERLNAACLHLFAQSQKIQRADPSIPSESEPAVDNRLRRSSLANDSGRSVLRSGAHTPAA